MSEVRNWFTSWGVEKFGDDRVPLAAGGFCSGLKSAVRWERMGEKP